MIAPKVAVVILNWNGKVFLEEFLTYVIQYCPEYARVYIADNASTDDSLLFLTTHFPEVSIISLKENYGYTGGYNRALRQIEAEYYVLLNSDIKVTENWIGPIISLMDTHREVAACQPKILSYHATEYFEYAGAAGGFIDFLGYPFCRGRVFHHLEKDIGQYDDRIEVFWATGACMFLRAKDFWDAGGLDDDFFAHMEEIDLCWRLKRIGNKIMCCPDSKVYHVGGGTLPNNSPRKTFFNFRNNLLLLAKNLPPSLFYPVLLMRFLLDQFASVKFLLNGQGKDFIAVHRAWYYAIKSIRVKRRQGHKLGYNKVTCIYGKSIVLMFYLLKKRKFNHLRPSDFSCY